MTAPTKTKLAEVYRQAAQVIATGGLCKRSYEVDGQHCAVGALRAVVGLTEPDLLSGTVTENGFLRPLATLGLGAQPEPCACGCGETFTNSFDAITRFNDRNETTADDVVALFNRTADALEAEL